jgi:hypothetical protein
MKKARIIAICAHLMAISFPASFFFAHFFAYFPVLPSIS